MEGGQKGKGSKWKVVEMKSGQNKKYRTVDKIKKWSKWKVVKIESGQNEKCSKLKVVTIGQNE